MDTCIGMAERVHCTPETITTLLTSYIPIQNKKLKKIKIIHREGIKEILTNYLLEKQFLLKHS